MHGPVSAKGESERPLFSHLARLPRDPGRQPTGRRSGGHVRLPEPDRAATREGAFRRNNGVRVVGPGRPITMATKAGMLNK